MRHRAYPGNTPVIMKRCQPLQQHRGSVHHTVFYSTFELLDCQEELNKEKEKEYIKRIFNEIEE